MDSSPARSSTSSSGRKWHSHNVTREAYHTHQATPDGKQGRPRLRRRVVRLRRWRYRVEATPPATPLSVRRLVPIALPTWWPWELECPRGRVRFPEASRIAEIVSPRHNLYQSLHATILGPKGRPLEVQIRTVDMHERAERGVAAHWSYKEGGSSPTPGELHWVARLLDWSVEEESGSSFMEGVRSDLVADEVFVFSPKGRVVTLPAGSTPVDFAYAIHTEIGHHCIGARVNDRIAALSTVLASGDRVDIITSSAPGAHPSRDWLAFVVTSRARARVRQWFARESREDAITAGLDAIVAALRSRQLSGSKTSVRRWLLANAQTSGWGDADQCCVAVAEDHVPAKTVVARMQGEAPSAKPVSPPPRKPRRVEGLSPLEVYVEGADGLLVRLAGCCNPGVGDEIIGFVTKSRGVSIHKAACTNSAYLATSPGRCVNVSWPGTGPVVMRIEVDALDRPRLLSDVARVLADSGVNIRSCVTRTTAEALVHQSYEVDLGDRDHLAAVLAAVGGVEHVFEVRANAASS